MSLDRLCSFVWWKVTSQMQKQADVEAFKAKLWRPPPGNREPIDRRSPWSPENETGALRALSASLGLTKPQSRPKGAPPPSSTTPGARPV